MNTEELKKILDEHKLWLAEPEGEETHKRANLERANLERANLKDANLERANLEDANLEHANLRRTNLKDANLRRTNLKDANLKGVTINEGTAFFALQCPEKGCFTAYKICGKYIIELEIPADAKRSSATTRKCRAEAAKVISITNLDGSDSGLSSVASNYDKTFIYRVGETVRVNNFDENRWTECSSGIHFFITRNEAVQYGR